MRFVRFVVIGVQTVHATLFKASCEGQSPFDCILQNENEA